MSLDPDSVKPGFELSIGTDSNNTVPVPATNGDLNFKESYCSAEEILQAPGFRIRIDLMRIRIRIRIQHFF
jgi:hypothetical protein